MTITNDTTMRDIQTSNAARLLRDSLETDERCARCGQTYDEHDYDGSCLPDPDGR